MILRDEFHTKDTFFRFMMILKKRLPIYLAAIVISTAGRAAFNIVSAYLIKHIIEIAQDESVSQLISMIVWNILLGIAMLLVWRFAIVRYNIEAKRGVAYLQQDVFAKALKLPMSYYEDNHSGDFMSKLLYDTNKAGDIFASRFRRLVSPLITVIVYLIPMLALCWQLSLCLLAVSLAEFFVNTMFVKPMQKFGKQLSKNTGVMTEKLTNLLSGIETAKIFSFSSILVDKYKSANAECLKTQKRRNRVAAGLYTLSTGFDLISSLAFLGLGVYFVDKGITTIGTLAAIYSLYACFSRDFLEIGRYVPELMNCLANAQRIFDFLDSEEEPERYGEGEHDTVLAPHIQQTHGSDQDKEYISFDNISFAYNDERDIIKDFSASVKKGNVVALTGASGKGKSTVAKLLLGFYPPNSGSIYIDGKSYKSMKLSEIRSLIGYVPQEPYLYNVSIAENISYGRPDASTDDIVAAAKAANIHDVIMGMDGGYDAIPGERGNKLSGGEKQRIAIARAILKNAPILLLDEATSALDNESEHLVNIAIDKLMEGRTTIMIAHRPSTIARADVVIEM